MLQTLSHSHSRSVTYDKSLAFHSLNHSLNYSLTFRRLYVIHLWCLFRLVQSDYLNWFRRLYENCDIQIVESFMCPEASLCKMRKRCWSLMQCIIREPQGILSEGFCISFLAVNCRMKGSRNLSSSMLPSYMRYLLLWSQQIFRLSLWRHLRGFLRTLLDKNADIALTEVSFGPFPAQSQFYNLCRA
jgi:hypothetical protein